jgi:hypothetical protein
MSKSILQVEKRSKRVYSKSLKSSAWKYCKEIKRENPDPKSTKVLKKKT